MTSSDIVKSLQHVFIQAKVSRDKIKDQTSEEYKRLDMITSDTCWTLDKLDAGDY